ncbi:MAG: acylase, partial [Chitinophagaceae bacterium]
YFYEYEGEQQPVTQKKINLQYIQSGSLISKTFTAFYTPHGPVMASRGNEWLSLRADNRLMNGLIQCWQRTKARGLADFKKTLDLKGNISNNTVYADAQGNIAYWHGNRIPAKDTSFNWTAPVDGSTRLTEWKGYHTIDQTVHIINPINGWLQNCNSTPFNAAGINSPAKEKYPLYMAPDGENFRGVNAARVLAEGNNYNLDKVIAAGYDTRLPAFEVLVPALNRVIKNMDSSHPFFDLKPAVELLLGWDYRSGVTSVPTTIAVEWGQQLQGLIYSQPLPTGMPTDQVSTTRYFANTATPAQLLEPLRAAIHSLTKRYGTWQVPWGQINRLQRISPAIENVFDDGQPSIPVGFASAVWGQLPSYVSKTFPGTKNRYGYNGNSFVCAVEFGKKLKAKSLLAGGNSGNPASPHYFDQAKMYSQGLFKEVLFYKEDVLKHVEKEYHPGGEAR